MTESACPACGAPVPDDARFCPGCGAALTLTCPGCGRPAERNHRFCAGCGRPLDGPVSAPAAAPRPEGERKQVTVLFADVAGSMDLAEGVDPEDWAKAMDHFFQVLSDGVLRFGGTVDKFTGDGIMALFGAPLSQEDHARRACHAALHLRTATADLDFKVRIGLNSGEVVVGGIGPEGNLEYTALGHTVGLAQRMEGLAEPGTAVLTGHTARLVRNAFTLRDLGFHAVKGSSEPVAVYALEGARRRLGDVTAGGSTVMVGRAEEMGVLETALARAQEGQAQVVGVVGEAGVGKSRLCEEFCRSAGARGIVVRRTAGVSHAQDVPLMPVLELLRDYFGITDTDSRPDARAKITSRLHDIDPALDESLPLMFDLLEVPDPDRPAPRLSPELRLEEIFRVIRRITQRRSSRQTLVFLWEDMHWFDPQSLVFIERLISSFPGTRTLVLTNFRPEFSPPWAAHSYYRQLPLSPLDPDSVGRLLVALLGREASLNAFARLVTETTEGSPFFVEEVIRSLVEDGTLTGEPGAYQLSRPVVSLQVPPTVQATLAARIDRLGERDKAVLQTAAAIGRVFTEPVVRLASGLEQEGLAESLRRLCQAEFLQETSDGQLDEYRFWHPLTQEVAYGSLLRQRRAGLHQAVARAIIETDADRLDERAALLAVHFEKAGDALEAARWHHRAGEFSLHRDIGESIRRSRSALDHLSVAPGTEDSRRLRVKVLNRLIRYGARTGMDREEAGRLYAEGTEEAERLGDAAALTSITFAYGSTAFWGGAVRDGLDLFRRAARIADESGEPALRGAAYTGVAFLSAWTGPVGSGLHFGDEIVRLCGGDADLGAGILGFGLLGPASFCRAEALLLLGRHGESRAALDRGIGIAQDRSEAEWVAWMRSSLPRYARTDTELAAGLDAARQSVGDSERAGNTSGLVVALGGIGHAEIRLGQYTEAVEHLEQALEAARRHGTGLFEEARVLTDLARARLGLGDHGLARQLAAEAVEVARRQGAGVLESAALLTRARIARATGGPAADVAGDLAAALALARALEATVYEAEIEAELAGTTLASQ